jgi:hypothetical protein
LSFVAFSWWDGVLEAADLSKKELFPRNGFPPAVTAKRRLFSSEEGKWSHVSVLKGLAFRKNKSYYDLLAFVHR